MKTIVHCLKLINFLCCTLYIICQLLHISWIIELLNTHLQTSSFGKNLVNELLVDPDLIV